MLLINIYASKQQRLSAKMTQIKAIPVSLINYTKLSLYDIKGTANIIVDGAPKTIEKDVSIRERKPQCLKAVDRIRRSNPFKNYTRKKRLPIFTTVSSSDLGKPPATRTFALIEKRLRLGNPICCCTSLHSPPP